MATKDGHIDFMFLAPPHPEAGSDVASQPNRSLLKIIKTIFFMVHKLDSEILVF